jgi:hypothetical protein
MWYNLSMPYTPPLIPDDDPPGYRPDAPALRLPPDREQPRIWTPDEYSPNYRIILMDLNVALSENFRDMTRYSMSEFVNFVERYRDWMVELLRHEYTVIMTARSERWAKPTLSRIYRQTGWRPQEAWFNDTNLSGSEAHRIKRHLLQTYVYPIHGRAKSRYLAIESNNRTREMYRRENIRAIDCEREGQWEAIPA